MKARVIVTLKSGVLDPQGKAIEGALKGLAVDGLTSVRQGKVFDIELDGDDQVTARRRLSDARRKVVAPVISTSRGRELSLSRISVIGGVGESGCGAGAPALAGEAAAGGGDCTALASTPRCASVRA